MDKTISLIALALLILFAIFPESLGKKARRVVDGFYSVEGIK